MITERIFETNWFSLVSKRTDHDKDPYYVLESSDCVLVLAVNAQHEIIMVRQFRPTLEKITLEMPSGHIDPGELPEVAAKRELQEETGYEAITLEHLGNFYPDTGRLSNAVHCYFSNNLKKIGPGEQGITVEATPVSLILDLLSKGDLSAGQDIACIMLAVLKRKITL